MSKHWPTVKIGDVLTERRETPSDDDLALWRVRIVSKIGFDTGRIELRTGSETNTGMILARPGDLVISGINAAKGAIAIYGMENTEPIAATIHYGAYTPKPDRTDLKFLWWFFRSQFFRDLLNEHVPGGIKTELKAKRFLPIPIPLPPLAEQRRVVALIEELAAQIHEARTLRHQAAEEAEVFVESASRLKFGSTDFEVGEIANVTKLAGFEHTKYLAGSPSGDVVLLRAGNVRNHGLDLSNAATIPTEISDQLPRSQLASGDVVMTFIGAKIGDVSYVSDEHPRLHCGPNVAKLTPKDRVEVRYLVAALQAPVVQDQIREITKLTAQPNLSMKTIRKLKVPVPPLAEQRRIVVELDALQAEVDALKRLQAETAAELDALLSAILDKAFKGELITDDSVEIQLGLKGIADTVDVTTDLFKKRAALDAYILFYLQHDKHFGRVKIEKVNHFAEYHLGLPLARNALRDVAGPVDLQSRLVVEAKAKEENWYSVVEYRESWGSKYEYIPGKNILAAIPVAEEFMGERKSAVDRLIKLFKPLTTKKGSIVATLYAAWNDLLLFNKPISDSAIINEVSNKWHPEKKKILLPDWNWGLDWLRKNDIIPKGFGKPISCKKVNSKMKKN